MLGVVVAFVSGLVFTDLAFGWSTTLNITAQEVFAVLSLVSWPWQAFLANATPTLSLVEASQFFRLNDHYDVASAQQLTQWWPFVLMTIIFWGLLPRVCALVLGKRQLQSAQSRYLLNYPGVTALLDRLKRSDLDYEASIASQMPEVKAPDLRSLSGTTTDSFHISWNAAVATDQLLQLNVQQDEAHWQTQLQTLPVGSPLRIVVKSWEPPLLEFVDFLQAVRATCVDSSIQVCLLGLPGEPVSAQDQMIWQQAMSKVGDHQLYVEVVS